MSEDIELGTSHLCTTEDAFEKFQVVSMFEEEEYMTLADIVPPQPSVPEYGDLNQIPYDNEVILTTSDEPDGVIIKDTTGETEQPIQDSINNYLASSDNKSVENSLDNNKQPQLSKWGGRKKKKNDENNLVGNTKNQHVIIENTPNMQYSGSSSETRQLRQGRSPKKLVNPDISTELPATPPIETTESSTPFIEEKNPIPVQKKRGRPLKKKIGRPKKILNNQLILAADSTTLLSSDKSCSENDRVDGNLIVKTTSRRRTAKKLSPEFIYDQTLTEKNMSSNIDDKAIIVSKKKSSAKRLKRNNVEEHLDIQKVDETVSDRAVHLSDNKHTDKLSTLGNDKLDEISLSQLKHVADDHTHTIEPAGNILETLSQNNEVDSVNKTSKKNGKRGRAKKTLEISPKVSNKLERSKNMLANIANQEEDETDDLCLSQLKETIEIHAPAVDHDAITDDGVINKINDNETSAKGSTKTPLMSELEYNIDGTVNNTNEATINDPDQSLLVEDSSKRPIRRRVKQTLHYEQESDEDPFANMPSSSDDEPRKGRKSNRYHSDEEYYPGSKRGRVSTDTESDSEVDENLEDSNKQKKKVYCKKSNTQSPRKRGKKAEITTLDISKDDDIEEVLQSSVITTGDEDAKSFKAWGSSNEFENFLAKKIHGTDLKIKKVSSTEHSENNIAPLEIPVINQKEKKTVEMCSQTIAVRTESTSAQTTTPFDIAMKENVKLTEEQSEKACLFLNSIVTTTAELGQLMTQKSEDFIKKKIHKEHVTDTFKMDYCVRKSFLLFKLAKHNLMQMEEDLAKQYEDFLQSNKLTFCREKQKEISGKPKTEKANSDSDCEIVDEIKPTTSRTNTQKPMPKKKSAFNPKTVFLNKELSIKIAKKPSEPPRAQKKIDIKGRHTVWISDTVMVKKVKPTQSFLAQDSRNKKPPDTFITTEMVSEFFTKYYRQKALTVCAPFISTEWCNVSRECVCNYFEVKPTDVNVGADYSTNGVPNLTNPAMSISVPDENNLISKPIAKTCPEPLFKLCFLVLKNHLHEKKVSNHHSTNNKLVDEREQPIKLLKLCLTVLADHIDNVQDSKLESTRNITDLGSLIPVFPLKTLCYRRLVNLDTDSNAAYQEILAESIISKSNKQDSSSSIKSLFSLCVEFIQNQQTVFNKDWSQVFVPKTLKHIAFENIKYLLFENSENKCNYSPICQISNEVPIGGLTINSVNTLSEEAFLNLEQPLDIPERSNYADDYDNYDCNTYNDSNFEPDFDRPEEEVPEDTNWLSQVQMQELRSFPFDPCNYVGINAELNVTQIKLEPHDEAIENIAGPTTVKTEPCIGLDEMTIIPADINPIKPEFTDDQIPRVIQRQNSSSYDVEAFENFVRGNKLMNAGEYSNEDIFSQSASRIRRQHEPDLDEEHDMSMSLLVPQTYEPINIETVKGTLMESSSDDSSLNKKAIGKKKTEKKKKQSKKVKTVPPAAVKDKVTNEVASLTRKMREKIRQEEKQDESSDSENETLSKILRSKKDKIENSKNITPSKNVVDTEIQCNNVDSTENMSEDVTERFTGFTAIDQNETSSYQKFMKYVYDKIVDETREPSKTSDVAAGSNEADEIIDVNIDTPAFDSNEPIELLECVPTMPIFDDVETKTIKKRRNKRTQPVEVTAVEDIPFVERHGWKCYPVKKNDTKLCQTASICLEKLPEHFVETYFRYQDITCKSKDDAEVDRLTNLNTLKRNSNLKEPKISGKSKRDKGDRPSEQNSELGSRAASPANSDRYDELTPSEDEGRNPEDELPASAPKQTENILAKDSLMNDKDSDSDSGTKVKQEPTDEAHKNTIVSKSKSKVSPNKVENTDAESLMLTADKVMNKELNLLHAPVVLNKDVKEDISSKKPMTRSKQRNATKDQPTKMHNKSDEDSSSEEEKQWVNTKEKLLKRLGKKEDTSVDDAKRAKLVTEFIERRSDNPESHKRVRGRGVRSRKKFLERQKQLKVLSKELYGETSVDFVHNKRSAQAYFKGRRNIRKVIDKKSLARSTVMANMEEFERKRRLNAKQTKLRELLGCEEGVNVLVINDEVCLEYDFEECRPVVTIHPFFTKVMKAHQYEGVKFMWDACFESLSVLEAGRAGGGCILAHCMGLGKTLQVLALLHTVLTHPRVGMRRVLVCCPLSTVLNWVDEIHKWLGPVTNAIKVFELSKLKKTYERAYQLEDWYNGGGIFIIGYELFRSLSTMDPLLDDVRPTIVNKIRTALLDPGPDIIVCDEGHLLKNDCSVLAVSMSRVATKRRIVLTGTPMQNNLREYYCMVDFVKPNLLGTYAEYSNRFENPIMNGQHRDSLEEDIKLMKARTHILHKVLEGCLQRQEASVLYPYLPKKHEYTVFIPLTQCQSDMYKHYLASYSRQGKHGILKDFHILHKIWSHPQVLHNFQTKSTEDRVKKEKLEDDLAAEDVEDIKPNETELWWLPFTEGGKILDSLQASNKFMVVFKILEECITLGDKMLLFSTSLLCLDGLEYFLKKINKWSLGQEYFRLDGSVPAEVRQKWCREFNADNNEKTKLFLVSTRAGCLGLNMTAANRVVILDTSWNPAHDIQSIFRVYRFGQKKDCYIYRLVAMGTMEQKIYERSVTKQAVSCRVVDEQQIDRHYNSADLTELYKYDEYGSSVACGVAVGVHDVVLLRVARAVGLHAVHEHDSLLRGSEPALPEHERAAAWHQFQQEQEDKQVQNELVAVPKISLKRIHGHEYAKVPVDDPPAVKEEDRSEDYVPPGPKSRKGKKIVKCCIPVNNNHPILQSALQPVVYLPNILKQCKRKVQHNTRNRSHADESVEVLDSDNDCQRAGPSTAIPSVQIIGSRTVPSAQDRDEDTMVQKISDILLQHNYKDRKLDIATLISQVRRLVANQKFQKNEKPDELSCNIADVLLGEGCSSQPTVTNIMCESLSTVVQRPTPELITGDLTHKPGPKSKRNTVQNQITEPDQTKTRLKAAVAAKTTIDTIAQDVINLDDDDDDGFDGDNEYLPNVSVNDEMHAPSTRAIKTYNANTSKRKPIIEKQSPKPVATGPQKTKETINSNSIVLSDDEESPVLGARKAPEDDEIVPLPSSLLTNKNFIKIVAHTYSAGNPMLDDDAATLAAQYSTFKALKESEDSGKDITSGPIYDIAVNVLGKLTLKRLLTVNDSVKQSAEDTAALQFKENLRAFETNVPNNSAVSEPTATSVMPPLVSLAQTRTEVSSAVKSSSSPKQFMLPQVQARYTSDGRRIVKLVESRTQPPQTTTTNTVSSVVTPVADTVVPVGLIKRVVPINARQQYAQPYAQSAAPARDECILPDDDVRSVPDTAPAPAKKTFPAFTRTNSKSTQPVILNHTMDKIRGKMSSTRSSDPEPKLLIQIAAGKVVAPESAPPAAARGDDTICLDSDEEEAITPHAVTEQRAPAAPAPPAATPVLLTAAAGVTPPPQLQPLRSASKPLLLQNKLPQGSAQRKFMLVPASKVPEEVKKKILETSEKEPEKGNQSILRPQGVAQTTPAATVAEAAPRESVASGSAIKSKIIKTKCKPGDIFRISKTGQIEVLNKDDEVSVVGTSIDTAKSPPPAAAQTPAGAPSSITPKAAEPRVRTISSSSSNRSRSSSPDDPLSILKHVVHIQATTDVTSKGAPPPNVSKTGVTKMDRSKYTSPQVVSAQSNTKKTVASPFKRTKDNGSRVSKVGEDRNRPTFKIDSISIKDRNNIKMARTSASKSYSNNTICTVAAKSKTSTKLPEKGTSTKVVGNLKNIILDGSSRGVTVNNKKTASIDLTGQSSVQVTNIKKIPSSAPLKIEAKKRPTPAEASTSAASKKKKPMTLKDFDLDDLDDIIELE